MFRKRLPTRPLTISFFPDEAKQLDQLEIKPADYLKTKQKLHTQAETKKFACLEMLQRIKNVRLLVGKYNDSEKNVFLKTLTTLENKIRAQIKKLPEWEHFLALELHKAHREYAKKLNFLKKFKKDLRKVLSKTAESYYVTLKETNNLNPEHSALYDELFQSVRTIAEGGLHVWEMSYKTLFEYQDLFQVIFAKLDSVEGIRSLLWKTLFNPYQTLRNPTIWGLLSHNLEQMNSRYAIKHTDLQFDHLQGKTTFKINPSAFDLEKKALEKAAEISKTFLNKLQNYTNPFDSEFNDFKHQFDQAIDNIYREISDLENRKARSPLQAFSMMTIHPEVQQAMDHILNNLDAITPKIAV